MFGPNVAMTQLQRLPKCKFENLLGPRSEGGRSSRSGPDQPDRLRDSHTNGFERYIQCLERGGCNSFVLANETKKNVLRPHKVVVE